MPHLIPSYRYHKARDCAVVTIAGRNYYLGTYGNDASREKYHRLLAEHFDDQLQPRSAGTDGGAPLTVNELILAYWKHVEAYYRKDGKPTPEADTIRQALRFLRRLYGTTPAREFSPKRLKAVRQAMTDHAITRKVKSVDEATGEVKLVEKVVARGLTRRFINKQAGLIKRMFS
jgi:plasmid stabilization system protein ParE